ncbi:hypothetical protein [uncultured Nostoc sp.]|uniref:hypothetical protein n=1 Tax=uncultured Nostoc sp. TaxID=340711 RepID=UPI0035C98ADC
MKVNNSELISLLFNEPELVKALNLAIPYISVLKEKTILNIRCLEVSSLASMLKFRSHLANKLIPLLGYEIHLECIQNAIGETGMVAVAERLVENKDSTETKFLSLETLARATSTSPTEVKKLLGKAKEVIHPMEDGSEMITENAFDSVVLQWAKSFKDNGIIEDMTPNTISTKQTKSPRKTATKVLTSELTIEDIVKVKTGEKANSPNLTKKGVQETLNNFFSKVNMEDTGDIDAISAFIEGTTEFGQALRKKILAAYKKFTKGGNLQEIQDRLIEGAKAYLESLAAPSTQE